MSIDLFFSALIKERFISPFHSDEDQCDGKDSYHDSEVDKWQGVSSLVEIVLWPSLCNQHSFRALEADT